MIRVGFVLFDDVTLLDVAGPAEAFTNVARMLPDAVGPARQGYEIVHISADGGPVRSSTGMVIAGTVRPEEAGPIDTLFVPGSEPLGGAAPDPAILATVGRLAGDARRVASVCTGAFVLAELGLLAGRRATTHWRQAGDLARAHPRVRVESDTIHVRDGKYFTSAGITAGIDLALALIEDDHGPDVAREVARELVVFLHRPGGQAQFAPLHASTADEHPVLGPVMARVLADPAGGHSVGSMASEAAVSARHLNRVFVQQVGATPARWLEGVRVDVACRHILAGRSVTRSAQLSGFGSDETLRRAFARQLGTTPSEYRARFASARSGRDTHPSDA